jgi:hypothetical protein
MRSILLFTYILFIHCLGLGQNSMQNQYFISKATDNILNNCGVVFRISDSMNISEIEDVTVLNQLKDYPWLKDVLIDTISGFSIDKISCFSTQFYTSIGKDRLSSNSKLNKVNNINLKLSKIYNCSSIDKKGYFVIFHLTYDESNIGIISDVFGVVFGWFDNHNVLRDFQYHDHSEFYRKYNRTINND